ncbi:MAG: fasciclin domain-containing protein [Firmicutes bacterium]|nr:fasciclin domain-containing protein [Bacillota bacterium]
MDENQPTDFSGYTLAQALAEQPYFGQFHQALEQTGLLEELDPEQSYTVFAPFDEAFSRVPSDVLEAWQAGDDEEGYREFIGYHIVEGEYDTNALSDDAQEVTTLNGETVSLRTLYGAIMVEHVSVNMPDIQTAQGYVHGVDAVLASVPSSSDDDSEEIAQRDE